VPRRPEESRGETFIIDFNSYEGLVPGEGRLARGGSSHIKRNMGQKENTAQKKQGVGISKGTSPQHFDGTGGIE